MNEPNIKVKFSVFVYEKNEFDADHYELSFKEFEKVLELGPNIECEIIADTIYLTTTGQEGVALEREDVFPNEGGFDAAS